MSLLLLLRNAVSGGGGALEIDSEMPSATGVTDTTGGSPPKCSYSFTNTAGTYLLVAVNAISNGTTVNAVTYNGVSMTKVDEEWTHNGTGAHLTVWELEDPATGANNIEITTSSPITVHSGAVSFTGHAATPKVQSWTARDVSYENPITVTCTGSTSGNLIFAAACCGTGIQDPTTNTLTYKRNVDGSTYANNSIGMWDEAGGSVVMSTQHSGSDGWAIIAVEIAAGEAPSGVFGSIFRGPIFRGMVVR